MSDNINPKINLQVDPSGFEKAHALLLRLGNDLKKIEDRAKKLDKLIVKINVNENVVEKANRIIKQSQKSGTTPSAEQMKRKEAREARATARENDAKLRDIKREKAKAEAEKEERFSKRGLTKLDMSKLITYPHSNIADHKKEVESAAKEKEAKDLSEKKEREKAAKAELSKKNKDLAALARAKAREEAKAKAQEEKENKAYQKGFTSTPFTFKEGAHSNINDHKRRVERERKEREKSDKEASGKRVSIYQKAKEYRPKNEIILSEYRDRLKAQRKKKAGVEETLKPLNAFSTGLKIATGIIVTMASAIAALSLRSINEQSKSAIGAGNFNINPFEYYKLQSMGSKYGSSKDSFGDVLSNLMRFQTDPTLTGDFNSGLAVRLNRGLGINVTKEQFLAKPLQDTLSQVIDAALKRLSDKSFTSDNGAVLRQNIVLKELGGDELIKIIQNMRDAGMTSYESARKSTDEQLLPVDTSVAQKTGVELNTTGMMFSNQLDLFVSRLSSDLLPSLTSFNSYLASHKDEIANTLSGFADGIASFIMQLAGFSMILGGKPLEGMKLIGEGKDTATFGIDATNKLNSVGIEGYNYITGNFGKVNPEDQVKSNLAKARKASMTGIDTKSGFDFTLKAYEEIRKFMTKRAPNFITGDREYEEIVKQSSGNLEVLTSKMYDKMFAPNSGYDTKGIDRTKKNVEVDNNGEKLKIGYNTTNGGNSQTVVNQNFYATIDPSSVETMRRSASDAMKSTQRLLQISNHMNTQLDA